MAGQRDATAEQIVIVKRRGDAGDEHHHGGVWKIAYADFMTAMMAFFLVMWLINAANTETKASVASYFNPIKLTDNVARKKGLRDLDEKANATDKHKQQKDQKAKPTAESPKSDLSQNKLDERQAGRFAYPIGGESSSSSFEAGQGDPAPGHTREAGRSFVDPFKPIPGAAAKIDAVQQEPAVGLAANPPVNAEPESGEPAAERAEKVEAILQSAKAAVGQLGLANSPGIEATIENGSVVVALMDTSNFGMFQVGSAEPNADLLRVLQKLIPILLDNGDHVIIRGHTDSRPYRAGSKDSNWRLAMARAEAAYTMLRQSGIDEARFERIEAYADHKLRDLKKPDAAVNRRIEIVLRKRG